MLKKQRCAFIFAIYGTLVTMASKAEITQAPVKPGKVDQARELHRKAALYHALNLQSQALLKRSSPVALEVRGLLETLCESTLSVFFPHWFCAGMCLVLAGQPFDLIKVRLQTMVTVPGKTPPYTGAMDVLRQTLAAEGVSCAALLLSHSSNICVLLCSLLDCTRVSQHLLPA